MDPSSVPSPRSSLSRVIAALAAAQVVAVVIAVILLVGSDRGSGRSRAIAGALVALSVGIAALSWAASRRLGRRLLEATAATSGLEARLERVGEQRGSLETILGSMEEGVVLVAGNGLVAFANTAAHRLLGGVPSEANRFLPISIREAVAVAAERREPRAVEIEAGSRSRVRATAVPLRDGDGTLLVLRDVTTARRVEAMRRDFVANASHELKTPVASIQADAETMRRALADDPAAADRFARRLEEDAARLARLVSDLLDLSRLEVEEKPGAEPVRLDRVATEEVARSRRRAEQAGVDLVIRASPATVMGSPKDLGLLVRNLLDNAVRYTPEGGRVEIEVAPGDDEVVLSVRDTGVGIPTRDLPRIFERFYRVDPARSRETGGTGLGLSIARHVVEQHGGRIDASSELGRGSTFTVRFPAAG